MDNLYRAELELEVNNRVSEALKKAYERDADEFRSMMEQFDPRERRSDESRDLEAENRSLRRELSQAQASIDVLKAMIPTAGLIERYTDKIEKLVASHAALENRNQELVQNNEKVVQHFREVESRNRNLVEIVNEEVRKREFSERRSEELCKLLQRAEVGIGIDRRSKK